LGLKADGALVGKTGVDLLRVLPGFFESRPFDICLVANQKTVFVTYFPLQAALNKKIFAVVNNCPVPVHGGEFPLFRAPGWRDRSGNVLDWWLWDGIKSWKIGELNPGQRKLPIQEVINDTLLLERIEQGWTPETDRD
jgi:hypothetical protein